MTGLASSAAAADLTVRQITEILVRATPAHPAELSHKDLSRLDLSGLDFSGADLAGADLTASDLSDANFSGSDLAGARLDLTVIIRADFGGADLRHASLVRPAVSSTMEAQATEAPRFAGANLEGAVIFARLTYADLGGARLVGARLGADVRTARTMNLGRSELSGADLDRVVLKDASGLDRAVGLASARNHDKTIE